MPARRPRLTLRLWLLLIGVCVLALVTVAGVVAHYATARRAVAAQTLTAEVEPARQTLERYRHAALVLDVLEDRGQQDPAVLQRAAAAVTSAADLFTTQVRHLPTAAAQAATLEHVVGAWLGLPDPVSFDPRHVAAGDPRLEDAEAAFERVRGTLEADAARQRARAGQAFHTVTAVLLVEFAGAVLGVIGLTAFGLRFLARPLRRLTDDVTAVAGGDQRTLRQARLPELAALAAATDQMRARVAAASAEAAAAQVRSRTGLELHDGVLQALAAAAMALELDDLEATAELLADATNKARVTIRALLPEGELQPGSLIRAQPVGLSTGEQGAVGVSRPVE